VTARSMTSGVLAARGRAKRAEPCRARRTRGVEALLEAKALLDRCRAARARLVAMVWRLRERARERGREEGRTEVLRREAERLAAMALGGARPLDPPDRVAADLLLMLGAAAGHRPARPETPRDRHDIGHQGAAMERFPLAPPVSIGLVYEQCAFEELKAKRAILAERARALVRIDAELAMLRAHRDAVRHDAKAPSLGRRLDLLRRSRVADQLARLDDRERAKLVERAAAAAGAAAAAHDFAERARAYRALRQTAVSLDGEREPRPVPAAGAAERDLG